MKGQRKYPSLPSQQNVAGKSHIAEGMEFSHKTNLFYSDASSILRIHRIFLHSDFLTTPVLRDLESLLLLGITSLRSLFSPPLPHLQLGPTMLNQTVNRSVFL